MERTVTLDELGERSASDFLKEVAHAHQTLCVVLDTGRFVTIKPPLPLPDASEENPVLKPLPQFDVVIPEAWKDAVYAKDEAQTS